MRRNLVRVGIGLVVFVIVAIGVMDVFGQNIRALFDPGHCDLARDTTLTTHPKGSKSLQYTGRKIDGTFGPSDRQQ